MWSQTHYLLPVSLCAVCGASSTTSFLWSRCAVWRARLSPCLPTESLCCQREPDSATFLAELLSCVWSELAQWHPIAAVVYSDWWACVYSVVERFSVSAESTESHIDSSGLTQSQGEPTGKRRSIQGSLSTLLICSSFSDIIVQRSASEQTLVSLCIWYSKQM